MAKIIARNASLGIDDSSATCRPLSSLVNNIALSWSSESPEVTSFGQNTRERLQDGIKDWELTFDAFFSSGANEVDVVLSGILGGSTRFSFGPAGSTSGCNMYAACAILSTYDMTFGVADAATVSGTLVARSGSLTRTTFA